MSLPRSEPAPLWQKMDACHRIAMRVLERADVPVSAGVYAVYRGAGRVYVGKAANLRDRLWTCHMSQSKTLATSALRRNVAEHLGIASPADIKAGRYRLTTIERAAVREWLIGCAVAWRICRDDAHAVAVETAMKREFLPPLTKV